jgi:hypothetical protein
MYLYNGIYPITSVKLHKFSVQPLSSHCAHYAPKTLDGIKAYQWSHDHFVVRMVKGRNSGILSYDIRLVGLIKSHPLI